MDYRTLGKTGLSISSIGFGASSLGGVFHSFDENRGIDAVFAAIDAGINYIDVSPYYGHYKAETVLGKALKDIPHSKIHTVDKGRAVRQGRKEHMGLLGREGTHIGLRVDGTTQHRPY